MAAFDYQSLFLETLTCGAVQSYVDLVYLACDGRTHASQLPDIRSKLVEAETARRKGDTAAVITGYNQLADLFLADGNVPTSIYFLERSTELAKLTHDVHSEMRTCKQLGEAYESCGDSARAVSYYEEQKKLAESLNDKDAVAAASTQLVHVYIAQAHAAESNKDLTTTLALYQSAGEAAKSSHSIALVADTLYNIGRVQVLLGISSAATEVLEEHVSVVLQAPDASVASKGNYAYCALAAAHIAQRSWEAAQLCLDSIGPVDAAAEPELAAEVFEGMGTIAANQNRPDAALKHLNKALQLRVKLMEGGKGSRIAMDRLTLLIGNVQAQRLLEGHMSNVLSNAIPPHV